MSGASLFASCIIVRIVYIREWLSDWNSFANETRILKENRVHIHG